MTTAQRITGSDWSVWFLLFANAGIRGMALGVKASGLLGAGAVATTEKWSPSVIDFKVLLSVAVAGLIYGFVDFLIEKGLPTGNEVTETTETTLSTSTKVTP